MPDADRNQSKCDPHVDGPRRLSMIHPTAIIDPKAELDSDVKVGPYALIDGCVRIGSGTEIQARAVISGPTCIGKNNRVGYGAIIGSGPLPPELVIGTDPGAAEVVPLKKLEAPVKPE